MKKQITLFEGIRTARRISERERILAKLPFSESWFKTKPYTHQLEAFLWCLEHPRAALFAPIGSGKSFVAVNLVRYYLEKDLVKRVLVVAPLSVLSEWENEFKKHSELSDSVEVVRGRKENRLLSIIKDKPIFITNYEFVRIYEKLIKARRFDFVIADESTKIKSPHTKVSHAFWRLFGNTKYKLILSGLPTPNNVMDLYSQFKFLDSSIFGRSYQVFKETYGYWGGYQGYQFLGPKNLSDLKNKMYKVAISFRKEELFDLPPKIYEKREITLTERERRAYDSMKQEFLVQLSNGEVVATNVLTQFIRLQQICSGFLIDPDNGRIEDLGHSKLKEFERFLANEIKDEKILVFVKFIPSLFAVRKSCEKLGYKPAIIWGRMKSADRERELERFKNGDAQVLIGQIQTVAYGLNLTESNVSVFLESSFSYGDREQCEGRNWRLGQTKKVTVVDFVVPGTIDTYILKTLRKKKSLSDLVMMPERILSDGRRGEF